MLAINHQNLARSVFHYRIEPRPWEVEFGQNQRNECTKANVMAQWFSLSFEISFGPLCSSLSGSYYCVKWNQREKQFTPFCQSQPQPMSLDCHLVQHIASMQINSTKDSSKLVASLKTIYWSDLTLLPNWALTDHMTGKQWTHRLELTSRNN